MSPPKPPTAPKTPHRVEQLGRIRVDDYAWMKDDNWQQVLRDPKVLRADVRDHLNAENAYTKAMLASTEALQALPRQAGSRVVWARSRAIVATWRQNLTLIHSPAIETAQ